jgi:hypothetical protein
LGTVDAHNFYAISWAYSIYVVVIADNGERMWSFSFGDILW